MKTYIEQLHLITCECGKSIPKDMEHRDYKTMTEEIARGEARLIRNESEFESSQEDFMPK
jgi:hypothetical protein